LGKISKKITKLLEKMAKQINFY